MSTTINTSRAKSAEVRMKDYDTIPLSAVYKDVSIPGSPTPIDLTNYKFEFFLKLMADLIHTYSINAGVLTSDFLEKTTVDKNVLNMQLMWEDIRPRLSFGSEYRLIMLVTHPTGEKYVHINYHVIGGNY